MPTFTAIALDRLLEPGATKSVMKQTSDLKPAPEVKLKKRNSASAATTENKPLWSRISPALYATPEATPLPDSPSSFPPSPYIINHKRRGPRLNKSFSQNDFPSGQQIADGCVNGNAKDVAPVVVETGNDGPATTFTVPDPVVEEPENGFHNKKFESSDAGNVFAMENGSLEADGDGIGDGDGDDFFDPQESMSFTSNTDGEDGADHSLKLTTPGGEFYDAWEGTCSFPFLAMCSFIILFAFACHGLPI